MVSEFYQHYWGPLVEEELTQLLEIALMEDADTLGDITSLALIGFDQQGAAAIVARKSGIFAGMPAVSAILEAVDNRLLIKPFAKDASKVAAGETIAEISGSAINILAAERQILNFIGRLSGIATLTRQYVDAVKGTSVRIFDTRKTTPGWRRLEKYAVVCGGGTNHRTGLFDAVLIKDNHIALGTNKHLVFSPSEAVSMARTFAHQHFSYPVVIEIEVDTLKQLEEVLSVSPDIVLLDNMPPEQLLEAVQMREKINPMVELEASGSITLENVRSIAETGVERISIGALTHSVFSMDFGLDWK